MHKGTNNEVVININMSNKIEILKIYIIKFRRVYFSMLPSWLDCVKHLLQSWTGFQLAVVMQCGGSMTNEKANWFAEVKFSKSF